MERKKRKAPREATTRRYRSRGVDVEIREEDEHVEVKLDGKSIHISIIDGKVYSQLAGMFRAFDSVDDAVDTLLASQGRTWTLHGHFCDKRCGEGAHHHEHSHGHDHDKGGGQ